VVREKDDQERRSRKIGAPCRAHHGGFNELFGRSQDPVLRAGPHVEYGAEGGQGRKTILRSYLAEVKTYYFMRGHIWKLGYSRLGSGTTKNKIPRH